MQTNPVMSRLNAASESTTSGHRDTTVIKVDTSRSPHGPMGEKYLASGVHLAMRLWESVQASTESETERERDYEIVGYVIAGRAELHVEGQMVLLEAGSSYVVPPGARHFFHVLDPLTAVEATSPPYHVHGRDKPV